MTTSAVPETTSTGTSGVSAPRYPKLFGFGQTAHAAIGKLHEQFADCAPHGRRSRSRRKRHLPCENMCH
ncbi:MAG: hypothetical protein F4135_01190 [Acidimicrobiia bacterium]|nr:hypothetical protein [Acidimicrobiia bacterium]